MSISDSQRVCFSCPKEWGLYDQLSYFRDHVRTDSSASTDESPLATLVETSDHTVAFDVEKIKQVVKMATKIEPSPFLGSLLERHGGQPRSFVNQGDIECIGVLCQFLLSLANCSFKKFEELKSQSSRSVSPPRTGEVLSLLGGDWGPLIEFQEACKQVTVVLNLLEIMNKLIAKLTKINRIWIKHSSISFFCHEATIISDLELNLERLFLSEESFFSLKLFKDEYRCRNLRTSCSTHSSRNYFYGETSFEGARKADSISNKFFIKLLKEEKLTSPSDFDREVDILNYISDKKSPCVISIKKALYLETLHYRYCFVIMPYIEDSNFKQQWGCLDLPHQLCVVAKVAGVVKHLHNHLGLVHRDLKPDNFLLEVPSLSFKDLKVTLIDFGQTYFAEEGVSHSSGTKGYMSPEAIMSLPQSYPSDIYSLGLMFHHLFSKIRVDFSAGFVCEADIPIEDYQSNYPDLLMSNERIRPLFLSLLSSCLRKNPEERLSSDQLFDKAMDLFKIYRESTVS